MMLPADLLPAYLLPLMHLLLEVARLCLGVLAVVTMVVCFIALHYHVTRRQHTWLMGGLGLSFGGLALVTPWLVLWVSAPAIYVFAAGTLTQVCVLGLGLLAALSAMLFLRNKPTRAWTRNALYNLCYNARQVRHLARASEAEALAALYRADRSARAR